MRIISNLALLGIALFYCCGCSNNESSQTNQLSNQEFPVEVRPVQQKEWVEDVSTYGTVKIPDKVDIFSRMSGKLVRLLVKEEEKVKVDEVVAIVDRDEVGQIYEPVVVSATVTGKINKLYLKEGAKVSPITPILSIAKQEDFKLTVSVFETDLTKLKYGQESFITLDALPGQEFTGKITLIKSELNNRNSKGEAEITFDQNHPEILPGMFARVRIVVNRRPSMVIPPECIRKIESKNAVYVAKDNIAKLVFIELGSQKTDAVEVKSGLSINDTVIIIASDELKAGSRIKIIKGE